jgi:hypothetical protein
MSNLSNIGFSVATQEGLQQLLDRAYRTCNQIKINEGAYSVYTDHSGAELFIQFNKKGGCLGANPHFKGKSRTNEPSDRVKI